MLTKKSSNIQFHCLICVLPNLGLFLDNSVTHLTSGFLAGVIGVLATNPIDVVKSRMMNQTILLKNGQRKSHIYKGSLDCFIRVWVICVCMYIHKCRENHSAFTVNIVKRNFYAIHVHTFTHTCGVGSFF